jgi:uncharacterized oligopeptide transporter (OPT) family protein
MTVTENALPEDDFELPIEGFTGTPEEIERQWFEKVYKGRGDSIAQLTWRAVLMGSLLGGVLSLTNLYIGLKAGWGFGVAITACILSYSVWTTLHRLGIVRSPMTILENNCMQSTSSSAGYSTGGTLISAFSAYMMLNPDNPFSIPFMMGWIFFMAVLGVTMAIPMKRQMINVEQLRFPSGIAAAETLRALHSHGAKAMRASRALGIAGVLAAVNQFWKEGLELISAKLSPIMGDSLFNRLNMVLFGQGWANRTVKFDWDVIFIAAGALTGLRACASMLLGGTLCWAVFVPIVQHYGLAPTARETMVDDVRVIEASKGDLRVKIEAGPEKHIKVVSTQPVDGKDVTKTYEAESLDELKKHQLEGFKIYDEMDPKHAFRELVQWSLWGGVACMIASGLLSIGFQWRSALRALGGLGKLFSRDDSRASKEMEAIEVPTSWFIAGQLFGLIGLAWLANAAFGMPWWQSTVAVLLTFILALVACRVTGETDTTPIGAMGKVTQLIFGPLNPGNMTVNLMSANITAGAAASSADLLTDLKSGYLLGANPRKQFLAQFAGIFTGTVVTVLCFRALVPDPSVLGTDQFPAPSAQTWKAVAEALSKGLESLHPLKVSCIAVGALIGIVLPVLAKLFPKHEKWIPSAPALGLSWTFQWFTSLLFFIGAVIGYCWEKKSPEQSKEFLFPVASGIIAGGSLMAVVIIFWENGPALIAQIIHALKR